MPPKCPIKARSMNLYAAEKYNELLNKVNWSIIYGKKECDEPWHVFISQMNEVMDTIVPF